MQTSLLRTSETSEWADERTLQQQLDNKDLIISETRHRISNILQILAGVLLAKARLCHSDEARSELCDAHRRVLSVAAIQQHLDVAPGRSSIDLARYLSDLCGTLTKSMIGEDKPVTVTVDADGHTVCSSHAVSFGLIVTELVMNALKHAFPSPKPGASILVSYKTAEHDWSLSVCDNGVGKTPTQSMTFTAGLGARLIDLLAKQLDAQVSTATGRCGMTVSVYHASHSRAAAST